MECPLGLRSKVDAGSLLEDKWFLYDVGVVELCSPGDSQDPVQQLLAAWEKISFPW